MHYSTNNIDHKSAIARSFSRAANTYDQVAILQREIGFRLLERLDLIKINPAVILDLGGGTGFLSRQLIQKYPNAHTIHCDIAEGMLTFAKKSSTTNYINSSIEPQLSYLCSDGDYLPIADQTVDFVFSNCALQWFPSLEATFQEVSRILKPNGLLLFSTLGQDTLKELRASFSMIDDNQHVNHFHDMHDIGDIILHLHFQDPVMDMETIMLTYKNVKGLLNDLKLMGAHYVNSPTPRGLAPKNIFDKLSQNYETYRTESGLIPATFEIVYGHAWGSELFSISHSCKKNRISITQV
jgi:malonyl-CoA O-methyltransferase